MTAQPAVTTTLEEIIRRFAPRTSGELRLTPHTDLVNEAGIDSPRMIDIVLDIEDRFGFTVEDREVDRLRTFGDLVTLVASRSSAEAR